MTALGRPGDQRSSPGRRRRRSWSGNGRWHVEVRGLDGPSAPDVVAAVELSLRALPGVAWAEVDVALGRAVVAPRSRAPESFAEVLAAVGAAEISCGVDEARFPLDAPEHPGDREAVLRHSLALAADVAGLGFGLAGRVLRTTPLPVEIASVVTVVDNEPRIRHLLESHLGTPATDLGLAVLNAAGQSLSQGPLGLLADGAHRANLLLESVAGREAFERAEARRWESETPTSTGRVLTSSPKGRGPSSRPVPLPDGPVERYADRSLLVGAAGAAATLAATRSPRRSAAMLLAAVPKAARLGREAFAAHLGRTLSARDLLVLDKGVLRRLDRVDTLAVDASLLMTGMAAVGGVQIVEGGDAPEVHRHLSALFDPAEPCRARRRGSWSLGPPDAAERRTSAVRRSRGKGAGRPPLVLRRSGRLVAVITVIEEASPAGIGLLRQARLQGLMVAVAGPHVPPGVDADLRLPGGSGLAADVSQLQEDGCVVALVAPGGDATADALRGADCGIEVPDLDGSVWSGDLLVNDLSDVAVILDAIASAHEVSRQGVALSITGSGIGSLLALTGPTRLAASRASTSINVAALAGIGNGIRAARHVRSHGGAAVGAAVRWHEMTAEQTLRHVGSAETGLDDREAARRAAQSDDVRAPSPSLARSIVSELANPLTPVLAGGAIASATVGSAADAGIVAAVTALNAVAGGVQRFGAERAIASLNEGTQTTVSVIRQGRRSAEASDSVVPGDIVVLEAGDAVPADCRIIASRQAEVDESSLTGESEAVRKDAAPVFTAVLAERSSMLYEGTTFAAGEATAVVVAVGADTVANEILAGVAAATAPAGVEARLRTLTSRALPLAGGAGAAVLGLGLLRGRTVDQSIGSAVALAVAAVPEGLPLLSTMAQLASARRLSQRAALVRNPRAIEAIGRLDVLCTDKTGTLTEGRMQLRAVSDGVALVERDHFDTYSEAIVAAGLRACPAIRPGDVAPHLTDRAVIEGAARAGMETAAAAPGWIPRAELPFEPVRSYHAVLGATDHTFLIDVKGAPEVVIPRCRTWRRPASDVVLDQRARHRLEREVDALARRGMRILAVAERGHDGESNLDDADVSDLTLLGFLVLSDPVRPTAAAAVRDLRAAGVDVLMVTGDHPSTAEGIAAELDILRDGKVLTGSQLALMSDAELGEVIPEVSVVARVTPSDKVRVVAALQRRGHTVAMTGDGANDAPAIRLADVGIAIGDRATPAARRAADLVVTDERIETIVEAVVEGRGMWRSLREALAILLGGNMGEVAFTVGATAVTGVAPLSARQLLVVNLMTDVAPALAIALRPPRATTPEALLAEGPDASLGASLDRAIRVRAAATASGAAAAWAAAQLTGRRRRAGTVALVALVGCQLAQTVTIAGADPLVLGTALASAAALAAIVQTPGLSQLCGCTPLGPLAWGQALTGTAVGTVVAVTAGRRHHGAAADAPPKGSEPADPGVGESDRTGRGDPQLTGMDPGQEPACRLDDLRDGGP